jgi:predicted DCC family thiol-disulfide oxidoreductase YuxK
MNLPAGIAGLVLYDGQCGLCHASVRTLLRLDRHGRLAFAPLGGPTALALLDAQVRARLPDSVVFVPVAGGAVAGLPLVRAEAVVAALRLCPGLGRVLALPLRLLPRPLAQSAYDTVARWRKRLSRPPKAACPLVPAALRHRLLP